MSLKITDPQKQVAVLNRWADDIETQLTRTSHTAKIAVQQAQVAATSSGTGGVSSVGLAMPKEFVVTGSPVTSTGTLTAAWAAEQSGYIFQGPIPGLSGVQAVATTGGVGTATSVSATPSTNNSFGLYFEFSNNNTTSSPPAGWTNIHNDSSQNLAYKTFSSTASVNVAQTLSLSGNWAAGLVLFTGPIPTLIQSPTTTLTTLNGNTAASFGVPNSSGNSLIVVVSVYNSGGPVFVTVSDSLGNTYTTLVNQVVSGLFTINQYVFVVPSCLGGANTVTANASGPNGTHFSDFTIMEWGALPAGSNTPAFFPLEATSLPPINLASNGNGGVGGTLKVGNGGTGSNLASTGGVSQFLQQASAGSPITVVRPDFSDLAGASGQKPTLYNGVSLVANGFPAEYAQVNSTGLGAAVATTTLYAVPAAGAGQYRLSWNAKVTTVDAASSTLGPLTITYTDPDGVVQTITAAAQNNAGLIKTSETGNTTTTVLLGLEMLLNCKASTNIQYAMAYASGTAGVMKYNLNIRLEAL